MSDLVNLQPTKRIYGGYGPCCSLYLCRDGRGSPGEHDPEGADCSAPVEEVNVA